jgi:hypothetical protein
LEKDELEELSLSLLPLLDEFESFDELVSLLVEELSLLLLEDDEDESDLLPDEYFFLLCLTLRLLLLVELYFLL